MYEAKEQPNILQELQENSKTTASKIEGTFEYDIFATNAIEFAKQEIEREQMYKAAFAQTSRGEYLTLKAAEHGIFRKEAVKAIGTVTVKGTGEILSSSIFATENEINFTAVKTTQVKETANIDIEAIEVGITGNVAENTIHLFLCKYPKLKV